VAAAVQAGQGFGAGKPVMTRTSRNPSTLALLAIATGLAVLIIALTVHFA
jgi:hypothetical protein